MNTKQIAIPSPNPQITASKIDSYINAKVDLSPSDTCISPNFAAYLQYMEEFVLVDWPYKSACNAILHTTAIWLNEMILDHLDQDQNSDPYQLTFDSLLVATCSLDDVETYIDTQKSQFSNPIQQLMMGFIIKAVKKSVHELGYLKVKGFPNHPPPDIIDRFEQSLLAAMKVLVTSANLDENEIPRFIEFLGNTRRLIREVNAAFFEPYARGLPEELIASKSHHIVLQGAIFLILALYGNLRDLPMINDCLIDYFKFINQSVLPGGDPIGFLGDSHLTRGQKTKSGYVEKSLTTNCKIQWACAISSITECFPSKMLEEFPELDKCLVDATWEGRIRFLFDSHRPGRLPVGVRLPSEVFFGNRPIQITFSKTGRPLLSILSSTTRLQRLTRFLTIKDSETEKKVSCQTSHVIT